jgi:hypothetical protein
MVPLAYFLSLRNNDMACVGFCHALVHFLSRIKTKVINSIIVVSVRYSTSYRVSGDCVGTTRLIPEVIPTRKYRVKTGAFLNDYGS